MTFALLFSPTLDSLLNSHTLHSSCTSPLLVLVGGSCSLPSSGHCIEVDPPPPGSPEQFPVHLQVSAKNTPLFSNFLDALWMPSLHMLHCILMAGSSFVSTKREKHSENRHHTPLLFRGGLCISGNDWLREVVIDNTERDCTLSIPKEEDSTHDDLLRVHLEKKIRCAENFSKRHLCKHNISPLPHPTPSQKKKFLFEW